MYDFLCIDFETANNNMNSACSIGLVMVTNLEIVKEEYYLIKPPSDEFRLANIDIHGITYEMVKNEPVFSEIWKNIKEYFINSKYVIAHNARFDMSVLHETAATYNIDIDDFIYMDSINISSGQRHNRNYSLEECADFFGITIACHHNALSDARTCAQIVIESVNKSRFKTLDTYIRCYSRVYQKKYSELSVMKTFKPSGYSKSVRISELHTDNTDFNTDNPLYEKACVITGELKNFNRREIMQKIIDMGGIVKSSVSSKTDYLILGLHDKELVGESGISTKERKAHELIEKGSNLKIITEDEFIHLLNLK